MIGGIGVDACEIARIRRALSGAAGVRFRQRVFTPSECAYCERGGRPRFESYAARFAAKEAAMKALGTGWGAGVAWRDLEVVRDGDGVPTLRVHGAAARIARRRRFARWHLTLTHTRTTAIAWVVVERT